MLYLAEKLYRPDEPAFLPWKFNAPISNHPIVHFSLFDSSHALFVGLKPAPDQCTIPVI
jgi:hypothetical protein